MSKAKWHDRFPELAGSDEPLSELLLSGKIPEASYMEWASETYQIPTLDSSFFSQIKNFKLLLENPSPLWSNSFFPVHEWQGMLYIACLEPQEIQLSKKHCFVLGSYKSMKGVYERMSQPQSVKPSAPPPQPVILAPPPASAPVTPVAAASKPASTPTPAPAPAKDVPSWLPDVSPAAPPKEDSDSAADPFSASVVIPLNMLKELNEQSVIREKSQVNINPNLSQPNFKIPEITNVFKVGAQKEMTFTTTKTIMPFPESTKDFTFIRTVYSDQVIVEAHGKVQDNKNPQEALISAFKVLKDYYKKLMWIVRDQKGRAFPIACNDAWSFTDEAWNMPINFKDANPFRLAKFTQRPYHGPVFKSPVNDQYFKVWNGNKYPDVMTIIPVKMGGKVFGYFVGCEKGNHYHQQQTLEIMESVCHELVNTFVRIHQELSGQKSA